MLLSYLLLIFIFYSLFSIMLNNELNYKKEIKLIKNLKK